MQSNRSKRLFCCCGRYEKSSQTKGYPKDSKINIEGVEKLFAETGKASYVKICKAGGRKLSEYSTVYACPVCLTLPYLPEGKFAVACEVFS